MKTCRALISLILALSIAVGPLQSAGIPPSAHLSVSVSKVFTDQAVVSFLTWFTQSPMFRRAQSKAKSLRRWLPQIEDWDTIANPFWPLPRHAGEFGGGNTGDSNIRISWPSKLSWSGSLMMEDKQSSSGSRPDLSERIHQIFIREFRVIDEHWHNADQIALAKTHPNPAMRQQMITMLEQGAQGRQKTLRSIEASRFTRDTAEKLLSNLRLRIEEMRRMMQLMGGRPGNDIGLAQIILFEQIHRFLHEVLAQEGQARGRETPIPVDPTGLQRDMRLLREEIGWMVELIQSSAPGLAPTLGRSYQDCLVAWDGVTHHSQIHEFNDHTSDTWRFLIQLGILVRDQRRYRWREGTVNAGRQEMISKEIFARVLAVGTAAGVDDFDFYELFGMPRPVDGGTGTSANKPPWIMRVITGIKAWNWFPGVKEWGTLTIPIWPQPQFAGEFGAEKKWDGNIRISWPSQWMWMQSQSPTSSSHSERTAWLILTPHVNSHDAALRRRIFEEFKPQMHDPIIVFENLGLTYDDVEEEANARGLDVEDFIMKLEYRDELMQLYINSRLQAQGVFKASQKERGQAKSKLLAEIRHSSGHKRFGADNFLLALESNYPIVQEGESESAWFDNLRSHVEYIRSTRAFEGGDPQAAKQHISNSLNFRKRSSSRRNQIVAAQARDIMKTGHDVLVMMGSNHQAVAMLLNQSGFHAVTPKHLDQDELSPWDKIFLRESRGEVIAPDERDQLLQDGFFVSFFEDYLQKEAADEPYALIQKRANQLASLLPRGALDGLSAINVETPTTHYVDQVMANCIYAGLILWGEQRGLSKPESERLGHTIMSRIQPSDSDDFDPVVRRVLLLELPAKPFSIAEHIYRSILDEQRLRRVIWITPEEQETLNRVPGAAGLWKSFFGITNLEWIGQLEGFVTGLLSWSYFRYWYDLSPLRGEIDRFDLSIEAAIVMMFGFAVYLLLHFFIGVVDQNRDVRKLDPGLSMRASWKAMSGFAGLPLILLGTLIPGLGGGALVAAGLVLGSWLHGQRNQSTVLSQGMKSDPTSSRRDVLILESHLMRPTPLPWLLAELGVFRFGQAPEEITERLLTYVLSRGPRLTREVIRILQAASPQEILEAINFAKAYPAEAPIVIGVTSMNEAARAIDPYRLLARTILQAGQDPSLARRYQKIRAEESFLLTRRQLGAVAAGAVVAAKSSLQIAFPGFDFVSELGKAELKYYMLKHDLKRAPILLRGDAEHRELVANEFLGREGVQSGDLYSDNGQLLSAYGAPSIGNDPYLVQQWDEWRRLWNEVGERQIQVRSLNRIISQTADTLLSQTRGALSERDASWAQPLVRDQLESATGLRSYLKQRLQERELSQGRESSDELQAPPIEKYVKLPEASLRVTRQSRFEFLRSISGRLVEAPKAFPQPVLAPSELSKPSASGAVTEVPPGEHLSERIDQRAGMGFQGQVVRSEVHPTPLLWYARSFPRIAVDLEAFKVLLRKLSVPDETQRFRIIENLVDEFLPYAADSYPFSEKYRLLYKRLLGAPEWDRWVIDAIYEIIRRLSWISVDDILRYQDAADVERARRQLYKFAYFAVRARDLMSFGSDSEQVRSNIHNYSDARLRDIHRIAIGVVDEALRIHIARMSEPGYQELRTFRILMDEKNFLNQYVFHESKPKWFFSIQEHGLDVDFMDQQEAENPSSVFFREPSQLAKIDPEYFGQQSHAYFWIRVPIDAPTVHKTGYLGSEIGDRGGDFEALHVPPEYIEIVDPVRPWIGYPIRNIRNLDEFIKVVTPPAIEKVVPPSPASGALGLESMDSEARRSGDIDPPSVPIRVRQWVVRREDPITGRVVTYITIDRPEPSPFDIVEPPIEGPLSTVIDHFWQRVEIALNEFVETARASEDDANWQTALQRVRRVISAVTSDARHEVDERGGVLAFPQLRPNPNWKIFVRAIGKFTPEQEDIFSWVRDRLAQYLFPGTDEHAESRKNEWNHHIEQSITPMNIPNMVNHEVRAIEHERVLAKPGERSQAFEEALKHSRFQEFALLIYRASGRHLADEDSIGGHISSTHVATDLSPVEAAGTYAHEAVHDWLRAFFPSFQARVQRTSGREDWITGGLEVLVERVLMSRLGISDSVEFGQEIPLTIGMRMACEAVMAHVLPATVSGKVRLIRGVVLHVAQEMGKEIFTYDGDEILESDDYLYYLTGGALAGLALLTSQSALKGAEAISSPVELAAGHYFAKMALAGPEATLHEAIRQAEAGLLETLTLPTIGITGLGTQGKRLLSCLLLLSERQPFRIFAATSSEGNFQSLQDWVFEHANLELRKGRIEVLARDTQTQAIVIASPAGAHVADVKEALNQGKDVLVEKPLALNEKEARELVALAEARNRVILVNHQLLYAPLFQRLRAMVQSGRLGTLRSVTARFLNRPRVPPIESTSDVLEDIATHDLYMIGGLLGFSPYPQILGVERPDGDAATITMQWGTVPVNIEVSREYSGEPTRTLTVVGEKFTSILNHADPHQLTIRPTGETFDADELSELQREATIEGLYEPPTIPSMNAFLKAIQTRDTELLNSGRSAISVVALVEQAKHYTSPWFQNGWIEVGLHTTTGGKGHKNVPIAGLIAMAQKLLDHRMMAAVDKLEILRALRANSKNNDKPICFLLEGQPERAEEAAAAGASVLNGTGFGGELINRIRQRHPHILFIEDISPDETSEQMQAHLNHVSSAGVDGVLLKSFLKKDSEWDVKFPAGPFSVSGIRAAHPDWIIMPAGSVFQHRAAGVMARPEHLTPAVGFNAANDFDEQLAEYDFARADGRTRGSGKIEEFSLDSWQGLSVKAQEKVLKQAIANHETGDLSRAIALLAPLEQGKSLRVAFVPRGTPMNSSDPFASMMEMLKWQQITKNKLGEGFFKILDDGRTFDVVHTPLPGLDNQYADHLVNLGLASKPGAGNPTSACFLCAETILSMVPDELWKSWGNFNYYFNPFSLWPIKPGADRDDLPGQMVAAWNGGHRSQQDASDPSVLRELRQQWIQLNDSPSLQGKTKYRMMVNGWSYGNPDIHGGASQNHIHGQMMRVPFESEKAPIEWRGTISGNSVRAGRVLLLTDPDRSRADDVYGLVLEGGKSHSDGDQLDETLTGLLHTITRQGHSFDVFFYETASSVRVYVTGRVRGKPEGSVNGRASAEVLARENVVISQFERVYGLTQEQQMKLTELPANEYRTWLQSEFAAGKLTQRSGDDIYAGYYKEIRQVSYSSVQVDDLLSGIIPVAPRVILLDMGNVMVPIDPVRVVDQLVERGGLSDRRKNAIWDAKTYHWKFDLIDKFMKGEVPPEAFFVCMKVELELSRNLTFEAFKEIWNQIVAEHSDLKVIDRDTVRHLKSLGYKVYGFSNTDPIHHEHFLRHPEFSNTLHELDGFYSSYELGAIKPNEAAYSLLFTMLRKVAGLEDLMPHQILFVDDNRMNIQAGRDQGWQTNLFRGRDLFEPPVHHHSRASEAA